MNRKTFFPSVSTEYSIGMTARDGYGADPNDYISRFGVYNNTGADSNYWIKWDYLSASGPPQIWVITDDKGRIVHCWEAEDASDPDNPNVSPVELKDMFVDWHNLKINIPSNFKEIKKKAKKKKKSISRHILDEYDVDVKTKKLKKKNEP